jgi:Cytochrome c3
MNEKYLNNTSALIGYIFTLLLLVSFSFAEDAINSDKQDSTVVTKEFSNLPKDDTCISCHIEEEEMPEGFNQYDIHMQAGLSCAGCHGGDNTIDDEDEAMDEDNGFVGAPDREDIPALCGKCHSSIEFMRDYQPRIATDQVEQYYTSIHGEKFKQGDENVATCTSCHSSHGIISAKDPRSTVYALNVPGTCKSCHSDKDYMADYNIPTDQYEKYAASVHGEALLDREDTGAPACNDCHGNHGTTPPGVASLAHVCGSCHVQNEEYFSQTQMAKEFAEDEMHACLECHGNHAVAKPTDDMVGIGEDAICMECHDVDEDGYFAADSIHTMLIQITAAYDSALSKLEEVKIIGMDDVEIGFLLQDAHQDIIHSRTLVHTFDPQRVKEKADVALKSSRDAIKLGIKELDDYDTRRMGLGVATLFITVLAIALFFKIRYIEEEQEKNKL